MEERYLYLAAIKKNCHVLGPGNRFAIWVQGCPFSCPGCIADHMQKLSGGELVSVEKLAENILKEDVEGITISGGEPFLQAEELSVLIDIVRCRKNLGVIVYTGFLYESLMELSREDDGVKAMLNRVDLLIDGPYKEAENLDYGLKGSVNQRTILLSDRYGQYLDMYNSPHAVRKNEFYPIREGTFMAGIPPKNIETCWKKWKQRQ